MKKLLALILTLVMVLSITACGGSGASAEETIKIGMITDTNGINDQSFNQTTWAGLTELVENDPTFEIAYLVSGTAADYDTNIQTFLDEEYDLILCTGFKLADATRKAAQENPDRLFAIIDDASCADLPNVACLMFAQEQASYLVGIAAGMMTDSNTVGYVQGMISNDMNLFGIGFIPVFWLQTLTQPFCSTMQTPLAMLQQVLQQLKTSLPRVPILFTMLPVQPAQA